MGNLVLRLTIAVALAISVGCNHRHQLTWKHETIGQMHATIAAQIPPGTPLPTAQAFMEREGFECTHKFNDVFVERDHWANEGERHEGITFVQCVRANKAGHFLMSRIWTIALVHDGKCVNDVLVSMYVDGP